MSKSSHSRLFGRRSAGTVTVIEDRVHRSSARNAKLAFWLTATIVGLLAMTVAADATHPILALLAGLLIGTVTGVLAWLLVRIWPVLRLLWWWLPEICLALSVVYGWTALARHTELLVRLAVVGLLVGVPAAIPFVRRRIVALAWCVIVRHRLRVCFAQFIIANRAGSLPLFLLARPTRVGERVWIYLRPGLALPDLESRLDKIAVACHAATVQVERASERTAALVRIDIKRREVLTATVGSPLVDLVDPDTPEPARPVPVIPTALDLPDVTDQPIAAAARSAGTTNGKKPTPPSDAGDDITDWI